MIATKTKACEIQPCRVVVFGTGEAARAEFRRLRDDPTVEIIAFADNDAQKQGRSFEGLPVIAPEEIGAWNPDRVLIASMYVEEIERQLVDSLCVAPARIACSLPVFARSVKQLIERDQDETAYALAERVLSQTPEKAMILVEAEQATRDYEWDRAKKRWDQYRAICGDECPAHVYVRLAKACIHGKAYTDAYEVLTKGLCHFPDNPRILREQQCCRLYYMRDKAGADKVGLKLVDQLCPKSELDDIVRDIEQSLNYPSARYRTVYSGSQGGAKNYGFLIHTPVKRNGSEKCITKISTPKDIGAEPDVLARIILGHPSLVDHVPKFLSYRLSPSKKMAFLTLRYIEGRKATRDDVDTLLSLLPRLLTVPYASAAQNLTNDRQNSLRDIYDDHWGLSRLFCSIHEPWSHEKIFAFMRRSCRLHRVSQRIVAAVDNLEREVVGGRLYRRIERDRMYGLVHGDYKGNNVLIDMSQTPILIDWSHAGVGPKGYDLACLFKYLNTTWLNVVRYMDQGQGVFHSFTPMDQALFLYALIALWIIFLDPHPRSHAYKPPPTFAEDVEAAIGQFRECLAAGMPRLVSRQRQFDEFRKTTMAKD